MIIVKLMGGLGNQMFQYATAMRLAQKNHTALRLDVSSFENMIDIDTPRHYSLGNYKISAAIATKGELARMLPQDFQASLFYRLKRRLALDNRLRPLGESDKNLNLSVLNARDNTWLVGWWQNEGYFKDIRTLVVDQFQPKSLSVVAKGYLKQIETSSSVSIHIRRGDYITNRHAAKYHGLAPIDYYKSAMKHAESKVSNLQYFVFSDDLEWCRKNLPLGKSAVFVAAGDYEEIYLMSRCKHNIIANSSFSWWGAWLNNNPDKIVIAPKIWFKDKTENQRTDNIPEGWIRL